ncbi:MAG: nuclear transport factor 2 family protein [Pseudomonadota bacterium]
MKTHAQAVVIGGGVIGCSILYHLTKLGVSGQTVTRGWESTLNRYRERYGDGDALGQLDFDDLDVTMISDDVGVVVGRYALERDGQTDGGVFSLVLRRIDGHWRVVHDHTVADDANAG